MESDSVTGGSLALLAEYLIHYTITDGFTSLSNVRLHYWRICCTTDGIFNRYNITDGFTSLSKALLHYWRNFSASNKS